MRTVAVIPARLASTRYRARCCAKSAGKPLIGRVYCAVQSSPLLDDVIIATDSDEIVEVCQQPRLEDADDFRHTPQWY